MSLLHRGVLAQIMASIDPILETALAVVNPAAGIVSRVVLTDLEKMAAAQASSVASATGQDATVAVVAASTSSAPIAAQASSAATSSAAPALTAQDVIDGLLVTLNSMAARNAAAPST